MAFEKLFKLAEKFEKRLIKKTAASEAVQEAVNAAEKIMSLARQSGDKIYEPEALEAAKALEQAAYYNLLYKEKAGIKQSDINWAYKCAQEAKKHGFNVDNFLSALGKIQITPSTEPEITEVKPEKAQQLTEEMADVVEDLAEQNIPTQPTGPSYEVDWTKH